MCLAGFRHHVLTTMPHHVYHKHILVAVTSFRDSWVKPCYISTIHWWIVRSTLQERKQNKNVLTVQDVVDLARFDFPKPLARHLNRKWMDSFSACFNNVGLLIKWICRMSWTFCLGHQKIHAWFNVSRFNLISWDLATLQFASVAKVAQGHWNNCILCQESRK